jgi:transcription elongation factor GreB
MSRAFIDESASQYNEEEPPELKVPLPAGARNYMTPQGARRMREELDGLVAVERPRIKAEAARMEAAGSAADKAVLAALRKRLREMERRIDYLSRMAAVTEVVDPRAQSPDRVAFGATVTVADGGGGESVYRIVGVDESDPARGMVSWISPIARALVSRRAGERVTVKLPAGEKSLRVVKVEYT